MGSREHDKVSYTKFSTCAVKSNKQKRHRNPVFTMSPRWLNVTTRPTVVSEKLPNHKATSYIRLIYNFSKHRSVECNMFFASKQFKCQETEIAASDAVRGNLSDSVLSCGNRCLMMKWSPENLIRCVNRKFLPLYSRKGGHEESGCWENCIYKSYFSAAVLSVYIYEKKWMLGRLIYNFLEITQVFRFSRL